MAYFSYNLPTDNVASLATWAAEASADAAYPATNIPDLSDLNRGNPGKLTIKSAGGFTADFGSAKRVDVIVVWHNADATQDILVQGNASNAWGSPTLTTTLTAPAKREDGYTVKLFKDLTGVTGYSTSGFRWWRIHFNATPGNNSQFWGLKVWMGSIIRKLDRPLETQQRVVDQHVYNNLATDTAYEWRYDLQSAPRVLSGKVNLTKSSSWVNLLSHYRSAGGPVTPFLLIPDATINDAWFVRFGASGSDGVQKDVLDVTAVNPSSYPVTVTFTEVTGGGPEWT